MASDASGGAKDAGDATGARPLLPMLVTSAPNAYWKTDGQLTNKPDDSPIDYLVETTVAQRWEGFGGTFSERSSEQLQLLSPSDRQRALDLLFGPDGLRFTYGRIPVGSSDYAVDRYSLDETPDDTSMARFSIERDRQKLIPYIKAALSVRPDLHLWASPWSPPTWMKTNGAFDGGVMKGDAVTLQAYALYLTKFVQEYAKEGISIEVVHPQKEPTLALGFPSCLWNPTDMAKFIGLHLGPTFAAQKVKTKIFLGSLSEDLFLSDARALLMAVRGDATAMGYVKGFGFEWSGLNLLRDAKSENLPLWQNNHNVGNLPWGTGNNNVDYAPNDHGYALESWGFIHDWIAAGATAYFTSNMILDSVGVGLGKRAQRGDRNGSAWPQNALLVVDASNKLVVTPAFYLFRHLSEYVDPGAQVLGLKAAAANAKGALAFKNPDGSTVLVVRNARAEVWAPTVAMGGKKLQFEVPAMGWATVQVK